VQIPDGLIVSFLLFCAAAPAVRALARVLLLHLVLSLLSKLVLCSVGFSESGFSESGFSESGVSVTYHTVSTNRPASRRTSMRRYPVASSSAKPARVASRPSRFCLARWESRSTQFRGRLSR